ncbi:sugar phosphate isomerase/epimerase [Novosphingobium sp. G106]|uniref:sugar phosphate isomerase/epimerase family protein n=1 Tax=Novosphingobium sp. G106 TaxID=2849500 RepID=UPI001C2D1E80|nr:TIM barrel protein [Novosphingobium sp. G106]MBV1688771.1 sugar phosphate isomerase/epimerase [Novosphingobium sp. G106]
MHPRMSIAANCFPRASWADLAAAWAALKAERVGFLDMQIAADPKAAAAVLRDGGYALETVIYDFMLGHQLDCDPAVIEVEQARLCTAIDRAAALGARSIFMATGGRGALSWEQAAEKFAAAIAPCQAHAERAGIALLIEGTPTLYADLSIALSLRDTVAVAELADVGICLDVFSCWTEGGLRETIQRAVPRCKLIQIADFVPGDRALPARAVPGDGAIPIRRIIEWALEAGYEGVFDLELIGPRIDAEGHVVAARRSAEVLDGILRELGA